jgi:polysaccharide pyruvyl transferase WcaK-like protein
LQAGNVDYVGTRLHGGVFALQNSCRSIIISIDHRAEGFHQTNNLPILKRSEISQKLEKMICSEFKTEIVINQKAIAEFKSQFRAD